MSKKLLDSSDEDEKPDFSFRVNTDYASKYDDWRAKEEMQKLKDKYGDEPMPESSSSESEDEDAEALTPAIERDFFKTLAVLKSKDPGVYDKTRKFFEDGPEAPGASAGKSGKSRPMFLKDYERKIITEADGIIDESKNHMPPKFQSQYDLEQEKLKQNLASLVHDESDDDDDLLVKRERTKEQVEQEDHDYANWLKSTKKDADNSESLSALKPLKDYWSDPTLDDGEKFLRDYLLDRKYIDKDAARIPSYSEIVDEHFSEEEAEIDKAEEFEHKYDFRFEEPDQEFIKRYPRTMDDSLRRKDDSRKKKRDQIKERKEAENVRVREEIKQLKNLKRREILQQIDKLKSITGNEELSFGEKDLEGDFDPDAYDSLMQKAFDDSYYQNGEEMEKPEFSEESDIDENWLEEQEADREDEDDDNRKQQVMAQSDTQAVADDAAAPDDLPSTSTSMTERKGRRRRRTKVSEAVQNEKPAFDPNDKKLQEYLDEYYKLDFEDVVSGIPCRFKYRSVVPNNFGLSVDEILRAPDRELNAWCSLKKTVQYRSEEEEARDLKSFGQKGAQQELKQRVIPSLVEAEVSETDENPAQVEHKKKRRRKKKKTVTLQEDGVKPVQVPATDSTEATPSKKKRKHTDTVDPLGTESKLPVHTPVVGSEIPGVNVKPNEVPRELAAVNDALNLNSAQQKKRKRKKKNKKPVNTSVPLPGSAEPAAKRSKKEQYDEFLKTLPSAKISDKRLEAYGLNPKKFRQKEKYVLLAKQKIGQAKKSNPE
ncbi:protein KRI1 homolog isoform X2 [Paramacrobiotus metropolitanus]|uniref:protein KRI1 homolog isoform X2 n=1 Tax=Paramacrobiotus metropolitanus TaxID=2943436 RepID=UPI002445767F|nr:protein KRI1 homolog isoform X2 [Paramacrobiotus metropolitanus]